MTHGPATITVRDLVVATTFEYVRGNHITRMFASTLYRSQQPVLYSLDHLSHYALTHLPSRTNP